MIEFGWGEGCGRERGDDDDEIGGGLGGGFVEDHRIRLREDLFGWIGGGMVREMGGNVLGLLLEMEGGREGGWGLG